MGTIRDEIIQLVQRSVKTFSSIEIADRQLTGLQTLNQMKRDLARNRIKEALHEIQVVIAKQAAEDLLELSNLVKEREEELTFEKVNLRTTKETLLSLLQETKEVILSRSGDIDRRQAELLRDKMKELVETDFSPIHLEAFSYLEFISHQKKPEELCVGYLRTGVLDPRQMSLNEVPGHTEQILEVGQSAALWLDTGAPISCQDLVKHAVVSVTGPGGDALACKMYELDSQIRIGFNVKEEGPYIVDVKVYKAHVSPCPMTLWAMNRETSKGLRANIMRSIDQSQSHQHLSVEPSRDFLRTDEAEMEDEPAVFEPARPEPTRPQPTQPPLARPEPTRHQAARPEPTQPQRTQSDPARPDPATSPLTASSPTPRTYGPRARRLSSPGIGPPPGFTEGYMTSQETSHVKECPAPPGFRKGHLGFDAGHAFSHLSLEDKKPPGLSVQPPQQTTEVSPPARHERSDVTNVPPIVIQPIEMSPLRTPKIKMEPVVVEKPTSTRWSPQKTAIPTPTPSGANSQSWRKAPSQQERPTRSETNTKQTVQPKPDTVQHKDVNTNKKLTVKDIPLPKEPYSTPPLTEITQPKHKEPPKQRSFGEREKELRKENEPPKQRSFGERERPKAAQRAVSKEVLASGDHHQTAPGDKTMPSFSYLTNLLNLRHGSNTDIPAKLTLELGKRGTGTPYVFAFPIGIATSRSKDEPDIIACDTGNNLVKIFTWAGKFKKALGTEESGVGFRRPSAVVVDKEGHIFVKDDRMIQKFSSEGEFIMRIGDLHLNKPYGLKLSHDGLLVTLDHRLRALVLFDASTGGLVRTMPFAPLVSGTDPRFRFLTVHGDKVAVVNLGEHEVIIASLKDGHVIRRIGSFGNGPGQFREPSGATVDSHGNLLVADSRNNRIQVFDMEGGYQGRLSLNTPILRPSDIHIMEDGHLIVDSYLQHCIKVYKLG